MGIIRLCKISSSVSINFAFIFDTTTHPRNEINPIISRRALQAPETSPI